MTESLRHLGLYTDFYEFTMAQAYFLTGKHRTHASFDYFYRKNPFDGGFVVFAGLSDLAALLTQFRFDDDDIDYLRQQGLHPEFLKYLRGLRFEGTIHSVREGEVVFPYEPIVRVEGNAVETQLIETILLNILNFESLIATKAARLRISAGSRRIVDFGLRRAQGFAGMQASKAAFIGGVDATSNVFAGFHHSLELSGTQAHSWIQCFDQEIEAFRRFAEVFPERCFLLVDTYNTLESGLPNAIVVAKELEAKGHRLAGVRLDSGDLAYLSKRARAMLNEAGFSYVKIVASNQLDEYVIRSLIEQDAPIDAFGVGTRLVTGEGSPSLDGVYKLALFDGKPRLKFSENVAKITLPGVKNVVRYADGEGRFYADGIVLEGENRLETIFHPLFTQKKSRVKDLDGHAILTRAIVNGNPILTNSIEESAAYARNRLSQLSAEHKRFENPHVYKVGISLSLLQLRASLMSRFNNNSNLKR